MLSSPAQDKRHALWFRAALQNRMTAALCDCNFTYGYLLFIQVCSDSKLMHSTPDQDKRHALWLRAALQNRMTAELVSLQFPHMDICCSYRSAMTQN